MVDIREALQKNDFAKVSSYAQELKDQSGFVGAGKIHYASYYIEQAHKVKYIVGVKDSYCLLVEATIEFKKFMRELLADYHGKSYYIGNVALI